MPIEEKSWKDIEAEYAKAKREKQMHSGDTGRWGKCPSCQGTGKATCPDCKGLGRNIAAIRSEPCATCRGTGKSNCSHPGCQGGWVKIMDKKSQAG